MTPRFIFLSAISIRGDGNVYYELASLSASAFECRLKDNVVRKPSDDTEFIERNVPFDQKLGQINRTPTNDAGLRQIAELSNGRNRFRTPGASIACGLNSRSLAGG